MRHLSELVTQLQLSDIALRQGELMCRHTSFQIGGPAAVMAFPTSAQQIQTIFSIADTYRIHPILLGAGSNMLAPDEGLDTLIVETRTGMKEISLEEDGCISADCGVTLARLAVFAESHSLTGLEFAHGIPGTVGGGVYMNAGAYGGELSQVLVSVTLMDRHGNISTRSVDELDLGYRHSCFMEEPLVILSAKFRLQPGDSAAIHSRMTELMGKRKTSQPLEFPSAGSTFKRPATGYAAALIEEAGLKGLTVGGAQVSKKHAGFVINVGRATEKDVLELMTEIRQQVKAHSGVDLEPEVRILEVK